MEVESTHVHVRPDGKKLIDVTLRRQGVPPQQAPLVVPRFEDDSSSSSDSSDSDSEDVTAKRAIVVSTLSRRKSPTSSSNNNNGKDEEEPADETGADGDKEKPSLPRQTFQGELQWDSVQEIQQLTNANAQHVAQVRDLRQQVKALQIQLEAQTPVPGLDVGAVQDILLDKDNIDHDVRDVKIMHQAKSLRALKRSLQREKQLAADAAKQCKLMEAAKQQLEQEVDTLQLKLQRFQVRAAAANHANAISLAVTPGDNNNQQQTPDSPTPSSSDSGSDSGALRKLCEELKVKNVALQQELKKTQRALVREVGDDVAWDEVLTNTNAASGASRRGRAQHIIMLKAKVKKLQAQLVATKSDSVATKPQDAGTTLDVDQRAQQDLSGQHMHRQKLLDQLTIQRDELEERVHRVTRKYDAIKARASTLDREKQETRSKFQVLVEKSRTDDALVDALQRQLETWKAKLHEARRARTADSGGKGGGANQEERGELERLRKVVAAHKSGGGDRLMPQPSEISQYRAIAVRCLPCTASGAFVLLKRSVCV
ncbi:hypothetical protein BBJ28_00010943 [Nothophytophthora sp. Chile5]|nr:hypothetical protein BBJ28_00010943 [Nothophytophthora sp. Chile5]